MTKKESVVKPDTQKSSGTIANKPLADQQALINEGRKKYNLGQMAKEIKKLTEGPGYKDDSNANATRDIVRNTELKPVSVKGESKLPKNMSFTKEEIEQDPEIRQAINNEKKEAEQEVDRAVNNIRSPGTVDDKKRRFDLLSDDMKKAVMKELTRDEQIELKLLSKSKSEINNEMAPKVDTEKYSDAKERYNAAREKRRALSQQATEAQKELGNRKRSLARVPADSYTNNDIHGMLGDYIKVVSRDKLGINDIAGWYQPELNKLETTIKSGDWDSYPGNVQRMIREKLEKKYGSGLSDNTIKGLLKKGEANLLNGLYKSARSAFLNDKLKEEQQVAKDNNEAISDRYFGVTANLPAFVKGIVKENAAGSEHAPAHQRMIDLANDIRKKQDGGERLSPDEQYFLDAFDIYTEAAGNKPENNIELQEARAAEKEAQGLYKAAKDAYEEDKKNLANYWKEIDSTERKAVKDENVDDHPGYDVWRVSGGQKGSAKRTRYAVLPEYYMNDDKGELKKLPLDSPLIKYKDKSTGELFDKLPEDSEGRLFEKIMPEGAVPYKSVYSMTGMSPDINRYPVMKIPESEYDEDRLRQTLISWLDQMKGKPQNWDRTNAIRQLNNGLRLVGLNAKDITDPNFLIKNDKGDVVRGGMTPNALRKQLLNSGVTISNKGRLVPTSDVQNLINFLPKQDRDYIENMYGNQLGYKLEDGEKILNNDVTDLMKDARWRGIDNLSTRIRDMYAEGDKRVKRVVSKDAEGNDVEQYIYTIPQTSASKSKTTVQGKGGVSVSYHKDKDGNWVRGRVSSNNSAYKNWDKMLKGDLKKKENQKKLLEAFDKEKREYMFNMMAYYKDVEGMNPDDAFEAAALATDNEFDITRPQLAVDLGKYL